MLSMINNMPTCVFLAKQEIFLTLDITINLPAVKNLKMNKYSLFILCDDSIICMAKLHVCRISIIIVSLNYFST